MLFLSGRVGEWEKGVVVVVVAGGGRVSIRQQVRRFVVEKDEWFGS